MLDFFKQLSLKRSAWIFLAFSAFALESTALYFQYGMGLQPCVLCVYERLAMVGLFIAGFIGALAPSSLIVRILALIVGLFSAIKGLMISIRHLDLQMNPAPWKQCEFIPNFPEHYHSINGYLRCSIQQAAVTKANGHFSASRWCNGWYLFSLSMSLCWD